MSTKLGVRLAGTFCRLIDAKMRLSSDAGAATALAPAARVSTPQPTTAAIKERRDLEIFIGFIAFDWANVCNRPTF